MQTILHLIDTTLEPLLTPEQIERVRLPLAEAIAHRSKSQNSALQCELEVLVLEINQLARDVHQLRQTVERLLYPVAVASLHDFDAATLDKQLT